MAKTGSDAYARLVEDLVSAGGSASTAEATVNTLRGAGLTASQARVWLTNSRRGHPVWTPGWAWQQVPVHAIGDGHQDIVLAAARRFAAATFDVRELARAFGCDVESAKRLCGGDPQRARTMHDIVRVLREHLSDAQISEVVFVRPRRPGSDIPDRLAPRMIDEMYDGNEEALLHRLRDGEVDLQDRLQNGLLHPSYIPGDGSGENPYLRAPYGLLDEP